MTHDPGCIFCRIITGDIPCFRVHEDDRALAFMDINPIAEGHVVVLPKFHARDLMETPAEWVGATTAAARTVARAVRATLDPPGLNLLQCNGPAAKQSVMHFHMHVIPRQMDDGLTMNWELVPGDMDAIAALAERIKGNLDLD